MVCLSFTASHSRHTACILALSILLGAAACQGRSIQAQSVDSRPERSGTATLQGFVRDSSGHPLADAAVSLQAKDKQPVTVRTDSAGAYRFFSLPSNIYSLLAEKTGYSYSPAHSNFIALKENESKTIDLTLEPAKHATAKVSPASPRFSANPPFPEAGSPVTPLWAATVPTRLCGIEKLLSRQ